MCSPTARPCLRVGLPVRGAGIFFPLSRFLMVVRPLPLARRSKTIRTTFASCGLMTRFVSSRMPFGVRKAPPGLALLLAVQFPAGVPAQFVDAVHAVLRPLARAPPLLGRGEALERRLDALANLLVV